MTFFLCGMVSTIVTLMTVTGWMYGCIPSWAARTINRFLAVAWAAVTVTFSVGLDSQAILTAVCALTQLLNWNHPKDDGPPPRRRRKKMVEKKEARPDWTGIEVRA